MDTKWVDFTITVIFLERIPRTLCLLLNDFLKCVFVCVCARVCVSVRMCREVHMSACVIEGRQTTSGHLQECCLPLRKGISLVLSSQIRIDWLANEPQGPSYLIPWLHQC